MGSLNTKIHIAGTEQERMPAPRYWNAEGLRRLVTTHNRVYVSICEVPGGAADGYVFSWEGVAA